MQDKPKANEVSILGTEMVPSYLIQSWVHRTTFSGLNLSCTGCALVRMQRPACSSTCSTLTSPEKRSCFPRYVSALIVCLSVARAYAEPFVARRKALGLPSRPAVTTPLSYIGGPTITQWRRRCSKLGSFSFSRRRRSTTGEQTGPQPSSGMQAEREKSVALEYMH
jgi:hypothetical protein